METKFYGFSQTNSGGYFDEDENVCNRVFIEAENEKQAIAKFEPMIENQSPSCHCCGERWSSYSPDEIDLAKYQKDGYYISIYTHYKDYQQRWFGLYGNIPRKEEPVLIKKSYGEEFGTKVYFENIEQYAQFMSNAYSISSLGAIIHYADGRKLKFFQTIFK